MKKILLTLALMLGIYFLLSPNPYIEASIFEEDPGPMDIDYDKGE
ncbi:hypothetical protein [Ornithinibacillus bavariensis]|uniref:Uncharacterized protein n=1 Tax=Ornithinibacillus bavariensis TaxID=545502 RepID=A0A920C6J3_9BACI|nr:hypothetical protein [Ornithinibacillus bavariensis]GIO27986.1 hypothetical protein J43TS3_25970 [Ornithinibacillus bavariensis]